MQTLKMRLFERMKKLDIPQDTHDHFQNILQNVLQRLNDYFTWINILLNIQLMQIHCTNGIRNFFTSTVSRLLRLLLLLPGTGRTQQFEYKCQGVAQKIENGKQSESIYSELLKIKEDYVFRESVWLVVL